MKNSWKKLIAITCALSMIVCLLPAVTFAEDEAATPTDLAPLPESAQVEETAEELAEEPDTESEEDKATYIARIAVAKRDGKIYLTAVVEPELVGSVIWEKKQINQEGEKWVKIQNDSPTLMIVPGSELIGKEIRFRLEDGTACILNYIVPELEEEVPTEEPAESVDDLPEEEPAMEAETEIPEEHVEELPAEETADELAEEEPAEDFSEEELVIEIIEVEPEAIPEDVEIEIIEEKVPAPQKPVAEKAEEADEEPESEEIIDGLDIREEPDGMSVIINTIPKDTELEVLGFEGDWALVEAEGEQGYVYVNDMEITPEAEEQRDDNEEAETPDESDIKEPVTTDNMKITIFTSRRKIMHPGEAITLTSVLEGFENCNEIYYQWECDQGDGFKPVEGANEDTYTYSATAETLNWSWRLMVSFR